MFIVACVKMWTFLLLSFLLINHLSLLEDEHFHQSWFFLTSIEKKRDAILEVNQSSVRKIKKEEADSSYQELVFEDEFAREEPLWTLGE